MTRRCATFLSVTLGASLWIQQPAAAAGSRTRVKENAPSEPTISCSPEKPTAWPREKIRVRVWVPQGVHASQYKWSATAGLVENGSDATWDLGGVHPGTYTATVAISGVKPEWSSCSLQVVVMERNGERGLERVTGRSVLVGDAPEADGYGLYSYLLLATPPDDSSHERYRKAIEAYLSLIPDVANLEKYLKPAELNNTYIIVDAELPKLISAEWVLQHYNYARALVILRSVPGTHRDGPYILSSLKPVTGQSGLTDKYLFQDLSTVPPHLLESWTKEVINQAAQEHFWETKSGEHLVLKLRTSIGILAIGLPQVQKALDDLIAWREAVKLGEMRPPGFLSLHEQVCLPEFAL
jgi:hypothetical protein